VRIVQQYAVFNGLKYQKVLGRFAHVLNYCHAVGVLLYLVTPTAKMAKNTADFCENRKNHGKNTASNHGPLYSL